MKLLSYLLLSLILFSFYDCEPEQKREKSSKFTITDDLNEQIQLDSIPKKIVTLAPNLTEMIYALGVEKYLIGNTSYCNYPAAAKNITNVGDLLTIDYEKIVTLKPDLIFITVEGNTKETFGKLRNLGMKVFVSNPRNFEGIKKSFRDLSAIFGLEERANELILQWDNKISNITNNAQEHSETSAMFLVSINPIMLAGKNTFVNEFLKICNLKNIAYDVEMNYPFFNREEVLNRNPQIILHTQENIKSVDDIKDAYSEWIDLDAVKHRRVYYLDPDLFFRPGPRFAEAAETLNSIIRTKNSR